jgi:hypothetical protein
MQVCITVLAVLLGYPSAVVSLVQAGQVFPYSQSNTVHTSLLDFIFAACLFNGMGHPVFRRRTLSTMSLGVYLKNRPTRCMSDYNQHYTCRTTTTLTGCMSLTWSLLSKLRDYCSYGDYVGLPRPSSNIPRWSQNSESSRINPLRLP